MARMSKINDLAQRASSGNLEARSASALGTLAMPTRAEDSAASDALDHRHDFKQAALRQREIEQARVGLLD